MPLFHSDTAERPKFAALSRYQKGFSQNSHKGTPLQPASLAPLFLLSRNEEQNSSMRHSGFLGCVALRNEMVCVEHRVDSPPFKWAPRICPCCHGLKLGRSFERRESGEDGSRVHFSSRTAITHEREREREREREEGRFYSLVFLFMTD